MDVDFPRLEGNARAPLFHVESIRNTKSIHYVMKNGRLYDGNTLDEIWPRQKKAGPFYWQDGEGGTPIKANNNDVHRP